MNYKRACFYVAEHGYYVRTVHQQNTFEKYIFDGITKAGFDVLFARDTRESPLVLLFSHITRESPLGHVIIRENIPVSTFFNLKRIIWFCLTICCTIRLLI